MSTDSNPGWTGSADHAASIAAALENGERVGRLLEECAGEIAAINSRIAQELRKRAPSGIEIALDQNRAVEDKLQQSSEVLAAVILALRVEARERNLLDHRFAAVVEQEEAARYAALHDVLTGLPNRALFDDRLEHGFAHARRQGWTLAVMFLDLDGFKKINDDYGHAAGDSVLRTIATRLRNSTRDEDTVGRHGGDEFLYLLMNARDARNVEQIAEKMMKTIQAPCSVSVRDLEVSLCVKASIGIAIFPKDGLSPGAMIKCADAAMYRAKQDKSGYAFI